MAKSYSSSLFSSGYNPLSSLTLPNIEEIVPRGLILIVGPNSSGKTQLLQDIHHRLIGIPRDFVVAQDIALQKPDSMEEFLNSLKENGYIREKVNTNGEKIITSRTNHLGTGPHSIGDVEIHVITASYRDFLSENSSNQFMKYFGGMLSASLFLSNRLTAVNQVQNFDWDNVPPENDLQSLHLSLEAKDGLRDEIHDVFSKWIWLDFTRGNILCLRLSEARDCPPDSHRNEPAEIMKHNYRTIETEGDGFRSYLAICISLLLSRRPLCLIDEPELCLHPPQAFRIGRFIGNHAQKSDNTTIVATHSSHVLRGILDSGNELQIIRLTRKSGQFHAHLVSDNLLRSSIEKPTIRSELIFDGIFSDSVVIVEADGDRAVYESAATECEGIDLPDILYVPVDGTGGIKGATDFYSALNIPLAIITDLDLVRDREKLKDVLSSLVVANSDRADIIKMADEVMLKISVLPPTVSESSYKEQVSVLAGKESEWSEADVQEAVKDLRRIANRLDTRRKIKSGGIEYFSDRLDIQGDLLAIISKCSGWGLFLIPVGELEYWCPELMADVSKYKKSRWANEASIRIPQHPEKARDVIEFIRSVIDYLNAKRRSLEF